MSFSGTPGPNLLSNLTASPSLNATVPLVVAAAADNSSLGIILGAVSLGLVGLMGVVMGTNAMRRSGALNFLGALGVKTPPGIATGRPRTKEELAADAAAKTSVLGRMGTMITSIKGRSAQITKLVDSLPVPDSVKSFVHDPKSVLPKSARDLLDTAQSSFGQTGEPADLENADAPKAPVGAPTPKSILKKESRVTIAPTPTFSDDVVLDGGIQLTNTRVSTPTQLRRPLRNTIMDDTYDVYNTDNVDNAYENTLIREPVHSSSFVRNPGSLGTQGDPFRTQGDPFGNQGRFPIVKPTVPPLPEGCKCEACLAAKAAHAPPPPSVSNADVMKQLEDLKKFMVEQMKPQPQPQPQPQALSPVTAPEPEPEAPVTAPEPEPVVSVPVPVSASEPAERLPKIVYPENSRSHASPITVDTEPIVEVPATSVTETTVAETQEPPKATIEVNTHELEEIRALLAERQKNII